MLKLDPLSAALVMVLKETRSVFWFTFSTAKQPKDGTPAKAAVLLSPPQLLMVLPVNEEAPITLFISIIEAVVPPMIAMPQFTLLMVLERKLLPLLAPAAVVGLDATVGAPAR